MLDFRILGRRFQARGIPAAVAEWLRSSWHFPEHDGRAPDSAYRIVLEASDEPPVEADRVGDESARAADGAARRDDMQAGGSDAAPTIAPGWRERDGVWVSGTESAGVRLSLDGSTTAIHTWGLGDPTRRPELAAQVHLAMCEGLRASELMPLHAAVAARDGNASAFVAQSGTGKSTTLLHAIRAGWTPIAEDFAWVDPKTLAIYGWDRGIRLWPEGLAAMDAGAVAGDGWRAGADGKLFLDYAELGAGAARGGTLTDVVLLERDGTGPAVWEPLPPRDAVRAMWEATGVPLVSGTRAWVAREIPRVLERVDAKRLRLGNGPPPL
jgi:hypothetical protein